MKIKDNGEFPISIIIEPTDNCNLHCSYCPRRFMRATLGFMDYQMYRGAIDEIAFYPDRELVLFHRGESLLHPLINDMLHYAKGKVGKVIIATNGTLVTPNKALTLCECADFVSFSIDLPGKFKSVRGGDYGQVVKNINYFLDHNHRAETQVSMVQTDDVTPADVEEFKALWRNKVDRVRVYIEHSKSDHFGSIEGSDKERKPCSKPFRQMVISWDGQIKRCNHDWDGRPLGIYGLSTIKEIWDSPDYVQLRSEQLSLENLSEPCKSCDSWYADDIEAGSGILYKESEGE